MERRGVVNVDFDDLLSATDSGLKTAIQEVIKGEDAVARLGTYNLSTEDIMRTTDGGVVTQHDDFRVNGLALSFLKRPEFLLGLLPHLDARESTKLLQDNGYEVHVVTARTNEEDVQLASVTWLEKHGIFPFVSKLHLRPPEKGISLFKREVAGITNPVAIFEDHWLISQILALRLRIPVYLIEKIWNIGIKGNSFLKPQPSLLAAVRHLISNNRDGLW